jgi:hypothetical protein
MGDSDKPAPRIAYVIMTIAVLIAWPVLPGIWLFEEREPKDPK